MPVSWLRHSSPCAPDTAIMDPAALQRGPPQAVLCECWSGPLYQGGVSVLFITPSAVSGFEEKWRFWRTADFQAYGASPEAVNFVRLIKDDSMSLLVQMKSMLLSQFFLANCDFQDTDVTKRDEEMVMTCE